MIIADKDYDKVYTQAIMLITMNFFFPYYAVMSADDGKDVVMKGITQGACDYLIKPIRIEAIKNIWQHVVRKRRNEFRDLEQSVSAEDNDQHRKQLEEGDYSSSANEGSRRCLKKRKYVKEEEDEGENREDSSTMKKPRVVWTTELHKQFVSAVNQLSLESKDPSFGFVDLVGTLGLFVCIEYMGIEYIGIHG